MGKARYSSIRILILAIVVAIIGLVCYAFFPQSVDLSDYSKLVNNYSVRILRDTWGVPHIFGANDTDASFGLAYAHAEDDFLTIQQTLIAAKGLLASVYGRDAVANDYMVHLLRIWDIVESGYEPDLMPETRQIIDAYADGLNYYASLHEDSVISKDLFPVNGKDIVATSVHKSPLFFGLDNTLIELFSEARLSEISPRPTIQSAYLQDMRFGSNTFSIGPNRTANGSTFLAVNSHQPWEGATTWYEAHIHSEEGWDAVGALFPGTPTIIHGHNRNLGWAFTVNSPDLTDVYVLDVHPNDPFLYRFDGEWRRLEVKRAVIKVKILGRIKFDIKQEVLWSVYGPVVRRDHGTYALRYAGFGKVNIFEQLYRMNKASNFEAWLAAMREGGLPNFNVGYADAQGNIYYLYNAMLPIRADGYDWELYLPGDTSDTLWDEFLPFEDLPQVLNPTSGFVQNCNSTPFQTTLDPWNPDPDNFSKNFGIEKYYTNRSLRAVELFGGDDSITFDEFVNYKYDMVYSDRSDIPALVDNIINMELPSDPKLDNAINILRNWDFHNDPVSAGATIMVYTLIELLENGENIHASRLVGNQVDPVVLMKSFTDAVDYIVEKFGSVEVPWSDVNRLIRGDKDMGLGGGPDLLHAIYGAKQDDGRLKGFNGDSYVMLISWNAEGSVESYSIHQYGSATLDPTSQHFADQSSLFAERRLKPVWIDETDIRLHLESEYIPGDEIKPNR